ncbi:peptidase M24, structural domain-containing protein [Peziza echinospora]|nr:peptidase M24, structural domain-containing protein [Peziza echinospora]
MTAISQACMGVACAAKEVSLKCPTCLKNGIESYFCSQDCFKRSWKRPLFPNIIRPQSTTTSFTTPIFQTRALTTDCRAPLRPTFFTQSLQNDHKILHRQPSSKHPSLLRSFRDLHIPTPYPSNSENGTYDPFPDFKYTGPLRPAYPLSPRRAVPPDIPRPDYSVDGQPKSEMRARGNKITILNKQEIEGMRTVCRLTREVLDIAAAMVRPGITTDMIDEAVHNATIERNSYPSPLNYVHFPKSVCTSVNETICHGIPDQRVLVDGDIINIDVSVYHNGFHGDLNETYYVGSKALANPDAVLVVETARDCLNKAIEIVKPGMMFRDPGEVIQKLSNERGTSVVKTYCGHGVNRLFHCAPNVPHYAKNKAVGTAKPGMCFTIEPMINLGTWKDKTWPDDWTSTTTDGKLSAQFEHTLLVTEDGVEVLTARLPDSPGGPVPLLSSKPSHLVATK